MSCSRSFVDESIDAGEASDEFVGESSGEDLFERLAPFLRVLTQVSGNMFYLLCEVNLNRKFKVAIELEDRFSVLLTIELPPPPDELAQLINVRPAKMNGFDELLQEFEIPTPRRLMDRVADVLHYPTADAPLWIVYCFEMEHSDVRNATNEFHLDQLPVFAVC